MTQEDDFGSPWAKSFRSRYEEFDDPDVSCTRKNFVSDTDNISYTINEYVIKYDHMDFSGENTDRFKSIEEAIERLKKLKLKGCFNFKLYHITKEVFDVSKI